MKNSIASIEKGSKLHRTFGVVRDTSTLETLNKDLPEGAKGYWAVASAEVIDMDGDVIAVDGIDTSVYHNPPNSYMPILVSHQKTLGSGDPPQIGRVEKFRTLDLDGTKVLAFYFTFATNEDGTPMDDLVAKWQKRFDRGYANAFSVGLAVTDYEPTDTGVLVKASILFEISAVVVPANPAALMVRSLDDDAVAVLTKSVETLQQTVAAQSAVIDAMTKEFASIRSNSDEAAKVASTLSEKLFSRLDFVESLLVAKSVPQAPMTGSRKGANDNSEVINTLKGISEMVSRFTR